MPQPHPIRLTVAQYKLLFTKLPNDAEDVQIFDLGQGFIRVFYNQGAEFKVLDLQERSLKVTERTGSYNNPLDVKFLDIVSCSEASLAAVVMGPLELPYYEDGMASKFASVPLDIQNPEEWKQTFPAFILWDLIKQTYVIVAGYNIHYKYGGDVTDGYVPFDLASGKLRGVLGILELAEKWYGGRGTKLIDPSAIPLSLAKDTSYSNSAGTKTDPGSSP
jgi:hypothetical protein